MEQAEKQRIYIDFPSEADAEDFEELLSYVLYLNRTRKFLSPLKKEVLEFAVKNFSYE